VQLLPQARQPVPPLVLQGLLLLVLVRPGQGPLAASSELKPS
jgi:hypothetical protein